MRWKTRELVLSTASKRGRWKCETWNNGPGNNDTKMQGWKLREMETAAQCCGGWKMRDVAIRERLTMESHWRLTTVFYCSVDTGSSHKFATTVLSDQSSKCLFHQPAFSDRSRRVPTHWRPGGFLVDNWCFFVTNLCWFSWTCVCCVFMFLLFFKMCALTNLFTLLQLSYRFVLVLLCITLKRICVECFSHKRVINQRYAQWAVIRLTYMTLAQEAEIY